MATYGAAHPEVHALLADVMGEYHPDLAGAGVTVGLLMVYADIDEDTGAKKGPALKHRGYPALAVIRVCTYKQRVAGMRDAEIVIDGDEFPNLKPEEQRALLDHELEHLLLGRTRLGLVRTDKADRPKLKLRPHDVEMGLFLNVIRRHGIAAIEAQSFRNLHRTLTQMKFAWG